MIFDVVSMKIKDFQALQDSGGDFAAESPAVQSARPFGSGGAWCP